MRVSAKISQAKAKLLVQYPLFGTIASRLELIINDDIQAFKSDGIKLEYNSDFFNKIELSQIEFALANGAMHASLAHEKRKNNRSAWLWQMATDFAINDMLVQNGMDCPHEAHYRKRFKDMYAEEIYAELKDDLLRDGELEYEAESESEIEPEIESETESETESEIESETESEIESEIEPESEQVQDLQSEQLFEEFAQTIIEFEIKKGEIPQYLDRFFDLNQKAKIDWRDELRVALDRFHKDDFRLFPANKKFLHMGLYIPSTTSQRFKLVIAIDSSGSVDEDLLNDFLSELNFLMLSINNYQIDLLVCDDKIHSHKTFYSGDNLDIELSGGGATDFRPVFEFIEKELQDTKLLIYFTDLDGFFPTKEPLYEVKWLSPKESDIPFGGLILLDDYLTFAPKSK
ncbi:MAG: hypothetical protein COB17_02580 [Sulfurimonas sp.]|nr:MAG: hypothetical protein COB17_02580 [Sulfurimonas sp.]